MMQLGDMSAAMRLIDWSREITRLVALTLRAWDEELDFPESDQEDTITDHLVCALLRLQQQEDWATSLTINGQRNEYDANANTLKGRNDIIFQLGAIHSFTWECKVLHRKGKTLYSEYRSEGMVRFLNEQYKTSVGIGGMLAYVLDQDTERSFIGVEKHLRKHAAELNTRIPVLQPSSRLPDMRIRESHYSQSKCELMIHAHLSP